MFLTEKEVTELTGIYRMQGDKSKHQLQAAQLRLMGIPFWLNARGLPKIAKENLIGRTKVSEKPREKEWEPPAHM